MVNAGAGWNASGVKPGIHTSLTGGEIGLSDEVLALRAEACECAVVGGLRHGNRHSRLQREHALACTVYRIELMLKSTHIDSDRGCTEAGR